MKLPFFRSSRPQVAEKQTITVPPIPTRTANSVHLAKTTRIEFDPEQGKACSPSPVVPTNGRSTEPLPNHRVPLAVSTILPQLPMNVFVEGAQALLSATTISIPLDRVLPQLSSGRIVMPLAELIPLFPSSLIRPRHPVGQAQQNITIPLADVVASIPADQLNTTHDSIVEIDSDEFENIPGLFDTQQLAELEKDKTPVSSPVEQPVAPSLSQPSAKEQPLVPTHPAVATESEPNTATHFDATPARLTPPAWADQVPQGLPEHVFVSLRALVALLPDRLFRMPRADLWKHADPNDKVPLSTTAIVPQIKTARVVLPLTAIVKVMPSSLLVNPLPPINNETVPLPLDEIIPQLPPSVFMLDKVEINEASDLEETDIPVPFTEKALPTDTRETEEPIVHAPSVQPESAMTDDLPTITMPSQIPVNFEDGAFAVFAEKPKTPAKPEPCQTVAEPVQPVTASASTPMPLTPPETPAPAPVELQTPVAAKPEVDNTITEPVVAEPAPAPLPAAVPPPAVTKPGTRNEANFMVNINRCSVDDLTKIPGIGTVTARRIVDYRNAHGHINSLEDLRKIPGIGRKTYRLLTGMTPRRINRLLGVEHDNELSLQEIVRLTNNLPGIEGCLLALDDGMFLTGNLPPHLDVNAVSVFAPQLFRKVGRYTRELGVGHIQRFTIFTEQQPMTIFQAGTVFLIIIHDSRRYSKVLLRRCERVSKEIARLCRQRAIV